MRVKAVLAAVCLAAIFSFMLAACDDSDSSSSSSSSNSSADAQASPQAYQIGDTVKIGGLCYHVLDVTEASSIGPEGMETQATGQFLVVRLRVANIGHDPANISASDFHLERGSSHYDAAGASIYMDGGFDLDTLNPGTSKTGTVAFDVPANTSPEKYAMEVYGNGSSDYDLIRL